YLEKQMRDLEINGQKVRAVTFNPTDLPNTPWKENETVALEHNLDAYSAFYHFAKLNKDLKRAAVAKELRDFNLSLWDKSRGHFWPGADVKTGRINKGELYLDNQSWGLLALSNEDLKQIEPEVALDFNCRNFYAQDEKIKGFYDTSPVNRRPAREFVWSEGTMGQVLAMRRVQGNSSCRKATADDFILSMDKMKKEDGTIAYATQKSEDFSSSGSVAGTAWLYFARTNLNPFRP